MSASAFYCVTSGRSGVPHNPNLRLLRRACESRGIEFVRLDTPSGVYGINEVPTLQPGGIYRLSVDARCEQFTAALLLRSPRLKTLRRQGVARHASALWGEVMAAEQARLSVIPSLYNVQPIVTAQLLRKINDTLGGFPVVLKKAGSSHGNGIMLIDSEKSLRTLLPHLLAGSDGSGFIFRKYIKHADHYRLVVLKERCLSSVKYQPQPGDIRTNAVKRPRVNAVSVPEEYERLAIAAVRNKGVAFGGVDVLAAEGCAYVAEVNAPCNFSRSQHADGTDIAGALVDYLCDFAQNRY